MADPTLYLYTSLTAGSSHIITATSRLETILKANKIPFRAIDCATDEKARQLWGRRSKGRKIPGLVKYGQVIGDIDQVEEWNEFGELKDQVSSVSDIFGDTPMTDTPMPPPVNSLPPNPLNPIVERPSQSRSSSETRHISISEPSDYREANSAALLKKDDTPLAMAMRQAGAEAAAKAGQNQKKPSLAGVTTGSSTTATKSTNSSPQRSDSPPKPDPSSTTPNPASLRLSADAALDSVGAPSDSLAAGSAGLTDAKTPAQLTADGSVRQATADRPSSISSAGEDVDATTGSTMSNEEQLLDMRRHSSVTKTKSRLAEETSIDDIGKDGKIKEESGMLKDVKLAQQNVEKEKEKNASPSKMVATSKIDTEGTGEKLHRGSSITEVPKEVSEQIEKENMIEEEDEEDADDGEGTPDKPKVSATDAQEAKVLKGKKPQDGKAAGADEAGFSVGD